jgi:hypothetical protein
MLEMKKLLFAMAVVSTVLMAVLMQATPMSGTALPTCPPYPGLELCDAETPQAYPGVEEPIAAPTEGPEIMQDVSTSDEDDPKISDGKVTISKPRRCNMRAWTFTVELRGEGKTIEEAWENATLAFALEPGDLEDAKPEEADCEPSAP